MASFLAYVLKLILVQCYICSITCGDIIDVTLTIMNNNIILHFHNRI